MRRISVLYLAFMSIYAVAIIAASGEQAAEAA